jgi:hypothetical protein
VFAPFLVFPVAVAKILFNMCSASLLVYTLVRASRFFVLPKWWLLLAPVVFFIPLHNNIFFGQAYLLLIVLLLEGFMAWKKGRVWLAALLWAIAIVFKLFPLVILFFLIAKKQYKPALYCVAACVGLGLLSLVINGYAAWHYYVFTVLPRANNGELNDSYTWLFQSAFMLLKNALVYDEVQNPVAWYNSPVLFALSMAVFKALLLAGCAGITIKRNNAVNNAGNASTDVVAFTGWITSSLLLSPNGSSYSLILLLLPLLAIGATTSAQQHHRTWLYAAAGLLFIICTLPVQSFAAMPFLLKFPRLYLLLLFFVLLVGYAGTRIPVKLLLVFVVLLALPVLRLPANSNDNSRYLLNEKLPLLYKYGIAHNELVYYYWDEQGSHATPTGYMVQRFTASDVRIQNNQVFYKGRQLTHTPDQKKQPMFVNDKYVIYLSDKNRGIGFYTLRVVSL